MQDRNSFLYSHTMIEYSPFAPLLYNTITCIFVHTLHVFYFILNWIIELLFHEGALANSKQNAMYLQ